MAVRPPKSHVDEEMQLMQSQGGGDDDIPGNGFCDAAVFRENLCCIGRHGLKTAVTKLQMQLHGIGSLLLSKCRRLWICRQPIWFLLFTGSTFLTIRTISRSIL